MSYDYDLFVIGGGSGGIATARRAAEYGAKVGVAEFDRLGGTCVNRGCIPKKLMVYASNFAEQFQDAQGYGWSAVSSTFNWQQMQQGIDRELHRLNGVYQQMLDKSEVDLYRGYAKFLDSHTLQIGEQKVTADKFLIAVGGHPITPKIPGAEYAISSDGMFEMQEQPKRITIIGGGYIGVEFACIMNRLGSEVTLIHRYSCILRGFDEDIRSGIEKSLQQHDIRVLCGSEAKGIEKTSNGFCVQVGGTFEEKIVADVVLAATGRRPNLEKMGLENTGVEIEKGAIAVNPYSQTTEDHIYAVGDCTNRLNLTPVAINEGRAFADTVFGGKDRKMVYENVPTAVFSTPEAATVGLTEAEAKEQYGEENIKIYRSRFKPTYHSLSGRDERTMMKLVVHQETNQVLGAHMIGEQAAEIIQGVAIAIKMGATKADFDATVAIHPTLAEEFVSMR